MKAIDFLVVGGGVQGLFTASMLAPHGRVVLLEANNCGQGASWAGGGLLTPLYPWHHRAEISRLVKRSLVILEDLCVGKLAQCTEESQLSDIEYRKTGLAFAFDQSSMEAERSLATKWANTFNYALYTLDDKQFLDKTGVELPDTCEALWLPEIAQLRNPRLLQALKQYCLDLGVEILEKHGVKSLIMKSEKCVGVQTAKQDFYAPITIATTGASADYLPDHMQAMVKPVKGQMLMYRTDASLQAPILHDGKYLIPRADGTLLAGSTVEQVGFDDSLTLEAKTMLDGFARAWMPELPQAERHWCGFRPAPLDEDLPLIGETDIAGLLLNTGHFRCGLTLGAASAELIAAVAMGQSSMVSSPFSPTRLLQNTVSHGLSNQLEQAIETA